MIYTASKIKKWNVMSGSLDGPWRPARPCNMRSLLDVAREVWFVLTGKADVLTWEE